MKSSLPVVLAGTLAPSLASGIGSAADIVDVAVAGELNMLVAALKAAGLVDTLKGAGPFTVFAPSNETFAELPAGTLETLLQPENKAKLRSVLLYHVVAGRVAAKDVMKMKSAKTAEGQNVTIKTMGSSVMVNNAHVIQADIPASNGVIHVIDTVLLPE